MELNELNEAVSRYSIEVNYRTTSEEVDESFAKLLLGYVSAAMKERGYHVKKVMDQKPYRVLISSKNWTDGEWVLVLSHYPNDNCFVVSKGFYRKDLDTVTVQNTERCVGHSAAEIFRAVYNKMAEVSKEPPHHLGLNGIKLKRGTKKGSMRPAQSFMNLQKFLSPSAEEKIVM